MIMAKDPSKLGISPKDADVLARIREAAKNPDRARADVAHQFVESNDANRSCHGKLRIRTPEHAQFLSKELAEKYGHAHEAYHCIVCDCYHLTTHVWRA